MDPVVFNKLSEQAQEVLNVCAAKAAASTAGAGAGQELSRQHAAAAAAARRRRKPARAQPFGARGSAIAKVLVPSGGATGASKKGARQRSGGVTEHQDSSLAGSTCREITHAVAGPARGGGSQQLLQ